MGILRKQIAAPDEKKEKTMNVRVSDELFREFEAHCQKHGYTMSEAVRQLMKFELSGGQRESVALGSHAPTQIGAVSVASPAKPAPIAHSLPAGKNKNPYLVNGKAPCPLCGKWYAWKNFSRHVKGMHGFESVDSFIHEHEQGMQAMKAKIE